MNISPLGNLTRDPHIDEWLRSESIAVPFFDNRKLPFVFEGIEADHRPEEFVEAAVRFLALSAASRSIADPHIFKVYREFCEAVSEDEVGCQIDSPSSVWDYIHPTEIFVLRRDSHDKSVYVQVTAECDWEIEHGLQLVFRNGTILSRVSDQDGHLTTADAFDLPEDKDRITY